MLTSGMLDSYVAVGDSTVHTTCNHCERGQCARCGQGEATICLSCLLECEERLCVQCGSGEATMCISCMLESQHNHAPRLKVAI